MELTQARTLIKDTFTQAFDKAQFQNFIRNLLNHIDESKEAQMSVPHAFAEHVRSCRRLGTYESPDGELADVLVVNTTEPWKLERTRTGLRDFVAHKLKRGDSYKEAGLIAFVSPDSRSWRFSFVRMEYQTKRDEKTGKIAVEETVTPARRFSYIVGEGESCHTAQTRFVELLTKTNVDPSLTDIEKAFSVEAVTKEFFSLYADLFIKVDASVERLIKKDGSIAGEFKARDISTVDFAKKLLGQIVFLYFLQKKGWLGVEKGKDWGSGPRDFLRRLADRKYVAYDNFFNDVLEPLFYDTLATDRGHDAWCEILNCRIPFLNGGLFEPLGDYNWRTNDIILPNKLFANTDRMEKTGDVGTGILDVFDRYNFTVNEAEPLEKEVAIDPEMLGKVFENLIEENRRKGLGSYYTPREIVHYMCQESLINYLDTAVNSVDESMLKARPKQEKLLGAPEPEQIDLTTAGIRELVPRQDLETFVHLGDQISHYESVETKYRIKMPKSIIKNAKLIDDKLKEITVCDPAVGSGAFPVGMMNEIVRCRSALTPYFNDINERTPYYFKRHAIQNCLYGVDIDPGAAEIAKLRLWLSLVVDEEDVKQIKPLPNLFYKIVTGNSLIGFPFKSQGLAEIERLKDRYFFEPDHDKKAELKQEIDRKLAACFASSKKALGYEVDFDFKIYFSEIFRDSGGFDVVIANPPYGIVFDNELKTRYESAYPAFKRNNDLYVAFYQRGLSLAKDGGDLTYISPNTFLNGDYFKTLREFLTTTTTILKIWDYKAFPIFDEQTVFVCVFTCTKDHRPPHPYEVWLYVAKDSITSFDKHSFEVKGPTEQPFRSANQLIQRSLDRDGFDELDTYFFVKDVGFNYWTEGRGKKRGHNSIGDRVFYAGRQRDKRDMPFIKGRDVGKWHIRKPSNFLRHDYQTYLNDADTFRYSPDFLKLKPKVIYRQTANTIIAAIDPSGQYLDKTVHMVVPRQRWDVCSPKLLLALLNSRLFRYFYRYLSQETEGRVFAQVKTTYVKKLPIPVNTSSKEIETCVDRILAAKARDAVADTSALEKEIDSLVYKLYCLKPEEIKIVEGAANESR